MAITSLASSPATPSQMTFSTAVAASTTPPSSLGLMSPRLTPKESHLSDSSDGSNSQVTSGGGSGGGPHAHTPGAGPPIGLTMPLLPHPSASSDDEMEQKYHKNSLFSSFLPIRHLRLRAQEHLEQATNSQANSLNSSGANSINKENGFDSTSPPAAASTGLPSPALHQPQQPHLAASPTLAYQQS